MQSPNTRYIERLDHLRFYAAALVVIFHTTLSIRGLTLHAHFVYPLFEQGHIGVQLFMVISGFILGVISHGKRVATGRFFLNRVLRIYPLFIAVVLLGYSSSDLTSQHNVGNFIVAVLPLSNISRLNYGEFGGQLWSVAVELQFYLLFPALLYMFRLGGRFYFASLVALLVLLRAAVFILHGKVHYMAYFTLFGSLDVFIAGHLLGVFYCSTPITRFSNPGWLVSAVVVLNLVVWLAFKDYRFFHVKFGAGENYSALWIVWPDIVAVLSCFLVIAYLRCRACVPGSAFFAKLGKYSYSTYLWHGLVIELVLHFTGNIAETSTVYAIAVLIVLPMSLLLSLASYHVIEKPFLTRRVTYVEKEAVGEVVT